MNTLAELQSWLSCAARGGLLNCRTVTVIRPGGAFLCHPRQSLGTPRPILDVVVE